MTIKQVQTLERNEATAEVSNVLTDENETEIVSNSRYRYAVNADGEPYFKSVLEEVQQSGVNDPYFTVKKYAGFNTYYRGSIGNLGSTDIVITFKNPVPNFYITVVNEHVVFSDRGRIGYPLGYIKAYDSDGVIVKGVRPAFVGSSQEVIINGVTRNIFLLNDVSDGIKIVENKAIYQFSFEDISKRIKKVVLEAPQEGTELIYYQSLDWNRPLPPPIIVPAVTQQSADQTNTTADQANAQFSSFTGNSQQFIGGGGGGASFGDLNNFSGGYGNHYHDVEPNPHIHLITPDPHAHQITPNPHRHGMRFRESGSFVDTVLENNCRIGPEILINLIYNELNTETAKEKPRVSNTAKKGNWITANKIGKPIWDYLENYYIRRIICYLQARTWYTEYETLTIVPTDLDILPTGLITKYGGGNNRIIGPQGTVVSNTMQNLSNTPPPQQENTTTCINMSGDCVPVNAASCADLGLEAC